MIQAGTKRMQVWQALRKRVHLVGHAEPGVCTEGIRQEQHVLQRHAPLVRPVPHLLPVRPPHLRTQDPQLQTLSARRLDPCFGEPQAVRQASGPIFYWPVAELQWGQRSGCEQWGAAAYTERALDSAPLLPLSPRERSLGLDCIRIRRTRISQQNAQDAIAHAWSQHSLVDWHDHSRKLRALPSGLASPRPARC